MKLRILILFIGLICFSYLQAQEIGKASYYHSRFHGRKTSSGLIYHKDSMSCAHRHYPFGTLLKVENLKNGKEVIVKVTDRGPFTRKKMIDLSQQAAKQLGMIQQGIAEVRVQVYEPIYPKLKLHSTAIPSPILSLLHPPNYPTPYPLKEEL